MKIAFTTLACPDWSFERIVDTAYSLGYDGIELRFIGGSLDILHAPELSLSAREATLDLLRARNLELCCLDSSVRLIETDRARREANIREGFSFVERAQSFGIPFVRIFGDTFPPDVPYAQALDWVVDGLRQLGQHAAGSGVSVLLESHGDFSRSDLLRQVMERVAVPQVGILYDAHHPWRFHGEAPQDTVLHLAPWIRHTHWKDSCARPEAVTQRAAGLTPLFDYVLPGQGEFPLSEALAALSSIHYEGWHVFEWEKKWHPEIADPEVALPHFLATFKAHVAAGGH